MTHRQRVTDGCPLTPRQLQAYELRAQGVSDDVAAYELGVKVSSYEVLLQKGRRRIGARTLTAAMRVLVDGGWLVETGDLHLSPTATSYIRTFEAYLAAPVGERDQMLVRDLCNEALDELLAQRG